MEQRGYPNPPITEAICQFNFTEALPWSVVTPGILYENLRSRYVTEPEQQEQVQAAFTGPDNSKPPEFQFNRTGVRFLYGNESRTQLAIVSPNNISVNGLQPYEGWPSLYERAEHALAVLTQIGFTVAISSVSVRYINQIRLGFGRVDLADYITIPIQSASFADASVNAFLTRTESLLGGSTKVNVTYASLQTSESDAGSDIVLDIDCVKPLELDSSASNALTIANQLKEIENTQFESVITDECRRLFK